MSLIRRCLPGSDGSTSRPLQERRKAVLICPHCEHSSPPDGDWRERRCETGIELRCPECYERLTVRTQHAGEAPK